MPRTAVVTAANGYIGAAVSRAFVRAGYQVFGIVRRASSTPPLVQAEIIPIIGTLDDLSFLDTAPFTTVDVIVNCLEAFPDYEKLFDGLMGLITQVAEKSLKKGVKPLVLWSSGCKEYGMTPLHGDPELAPHTEESPLNPPIEPIRARAEMALRIFDEQYHKSLFDGVVLRPTNVFGYTSSYYAGMLEYAHDRKMEGRDVLKLPADPNTPQHALHVDDCADAYVSLAEHDRAAVAGQVFNISSHRYETVHEIGEALAKEYEFSGGVQFIAPENAAGSNDAENNPAESANILFNFAQWVSSEKIRKLTGWRDKRMLWSTNLQVYRLAYEAEKQMGHENIELSLKRLAVLRKVKLNDK